MHLILFTVMPTCIFMAFKVDSQSIFMCIMLIQWTSFYFYRVAIQLSIEEYCKIVYCFQVLSIISLFSVYAWYSWYSLDMGVLDTYFWLPSHIFMTSRIDSQHSILFLSSLYRMPFSYFFFCGSPSESLNFVLNVRSCRLKIEMNY